MEMTKDYASRPNSTLLALAREGNEEAFTELVRRNSRMIYRISRKVLKNHEDAEDTLQNVLVNLQRSADDPAPQSFTASGQLRGYQHRRHHEPWHGRAPGYSHQQ